jgi:hypothetical protein
MKHNSAELIPNPANPCCRESQRRSSAHPRATTMRRTFSAIFIVLSIVTAFAAFGGVAFDPSWTYQGQLQHNGAAYNGTCNFQFSLWDAVSGGTQQENTQSIDSVDVVNGLFTVLLDFRHPGTGIQPFTGARWLETSVQCSGDGGFTPLDPRQPITPTPYALTLVPRAVITGPLTVDNTSGADAFRANAGDTGTGVVGYSPNGRGVYGESRASSNGTNVGAGVFGVNTNGGYAGRFLGAVSVEGPLSVSVDTSQAIGGLGPVGVKGTSESSGGVGIYGEALPGAGSNSAGVFGINSSGAAIWGKSTGAGSAIYGQATSTGPAGRFIGNVSVEGDLFVNGSVFKSSGNFRIDHPLDPANKFLSHSFVESPDMMNFYNGNVTTDATGSATISLPDYFSALNRDFRYQLTVLGQFAQAIVSREIAQNSFEIHTDKPGVKVSWQVTGIRQDAYAQANPIVVEESKPVEEQGLYLFPAGFGAGEEKQIGAPSRPATLQTEEKKAK